MHGPTWSDPRSQPLSISLYCLWAACCRWQKHKSELSCHACFNFSCLRSWSLTLHSDSLAYTGLHMLHARHRSSWNIRMRSFGEWSVQAHKTNIHTHVPNAVTLVWGSLRLAPINNRASFLTAKSVLSIPWTSGNLAIVWGPSYHWSTRWWSLVRYLNVAPSPPMST